MSGSPVRTHAVIMYDPDTGVIRHTLLETAAKDGTTPDRPALEAKLKALVEQQDPTSDRLSILHSENHNSEQFYKVDVKRGALVTIPSRA